MLSAPLPADESRRLETLLAYGVLDTPAHADFDDLTAIASQICGTPIALVTLVDAERQWFLSRRGLDITETPREISFCGHAIMHATPFVIPDAAADDRFRDNPLVTGAAAVRFYAGAPLLAPNGDAIGTLCVIDRVPRELSLEQGRALTSLARQVVSQLELRRNQALLRANEARFRGIVATSQAGIVVHGLQSEVLWCNDAACHLLGLSQDQLTGRTSFDPEWQTFRGDGSVFPPTHHPAVLAVATGRPVHGVIMGVRRPVTDDMVWVQVDAVPQLDEGGRMSHVVASFVDITALKRAKDEIRDRALMHESLLAASPAAIIALGADYLVHTFNAAAERLTGYRASDVVGQHTPLLWHDPVELAARANAASQRLGRTVAPGLELFEPDVIGDGPEAQEWTYVRKDGARIAVQLAVTAIHARTGAISGYMGIATDVTTRKEAEAALRTATASAEAANRAKSEFLATMSHEIRTPMNGVLGFANLLVESPLDERQREFAGTIKRSGESLLRIIDDILDLSKIEADKLVLERVPLDVERKMQDVTQLLEAAAHAKGIALRIEPPATPLPPLVGDPTRVRQVITNLVGNALKFTEHGHVTLRTVELETPRGPMLKVSVTDTGIGIPLEKQATLFQAFTQADSSTTRRYGGTGLGLAISRRLTELMGGTVGVESEPGVGSTFWFTLPVAPAHMYGRRVTPDACPAVESSATRPRLGRLTVAPTPPRALAAVPARAASAPRGPRSAPLHAAPPLHLRVLVAEDGEVNQLLLMHLLPSFGCHADLGRDGREAVALFEAHTYDIVLMDCHMPEMDGYEATAAMRAIERRRNSAIAVPIVALTASATADDRTQCLAAGMDDFLTKPFRPADLREVLARWTAPELDVLVGAP